MERFCFAIELKPNSIDEYIHRHDEIWPELVTELKAAGLSNYTLFRDSDVRIVGYVECEPDAKTCFGALANAEANVRWSAWFEDIIVSLTDDDGNMHSMPSVWHLA